jgi:hypothetical protein
MDSPTSITFLIINFIYIILHYGRSRVKGGVRGISEIRLRRLSNCSTCDAAAHVATRPMYRPGYILEEKACIRVVIHNDNPRQSIAFLSNRHKSPLCRFSCAVTITKTIEMSISKRHA